LHGIDGGAGSAGNEQRREKQASGDTEHFHGQRKVPCGTYGGPDSCARTRDDRRPNWQRRLVGWCFLFIPKNPIIRSVSLRQITDTLEFDTYLARDRLLTLLVGSPASGVVARDSDLDRRSDVANLHILVRLYLPKFLEKLTEGIVFNNEFAARPLRRAWTTGMSGIMAMPKDS
jgi:hypothetical protein